MVSLRRALLVTSLAVAGLNAAPASAATIWVDWTAATPGAPGSATGVVGGVGVTYIGELVVPTLDGSSVLWAPDTSWIGGAITESPSIVGDDLRMNGFLYSGPSSITFSSPVVNPVIAFWSLGSPFTEASFSFNAKPTFEAGGPNTFPLSGGPITVAGNVVTGMNGNGVVQFYGTYTSLIWTATPDFFYAFTVGTNRGSPVTVPEPVSTALFGVGLVGVAWRRIRR